MLAKERLDGRGDHVAYGRDNGIDCLTQEKVGKREGHRTLVVSLVSVHVDLLLSLVPKKLDHGADQALEPQDVLLHDGAAKLGRVVLLLCVLALCVLILCVLVSSVLVLSVLVLCVEMRGLVVEKGVALSDVHQALRD